ncbi:lipoprotein releasing system transmembrane protein LolC/E family [Rhodanobacter sp. 115]|nr:lipoprotein releasing system transmembrane protein LolC/E family [Rhodanobacter sp. 115]
MFRPLELFIGLRYTRAKRRNQFISFISSVSIVCITISVMALITVMSVMNGFDFQLRSRILGAVSDATVSSIDASGMQNWQRALEITHANPHVRGAAPYVDVQAFLQGRGSSGAWCEASSRSWNRRCRTSASTWSRASSIRSRRKAGTSCWATSWPCNWACRWATRSS